MTKEILETKLRASTKENLSCGQTFCSIERAVDHQECMEFNGLSLAVASRKAPNKNSCNEDSALVVQLDEDAFVLAVADGCGGMSHGEKAASIAIRALREAWAEQDYDPNRSRGQVLDAIDRANYEIQTTHSGAACTLAIVELSKSHARTYHVGDTEVLITGCRGRLKHRTTSHSPVGFGIASGYLSDRKAMRHRDRHLVANVVGSPMMKVEIGPRIDLSRLDRILIASDGLFDNLYSEEIMEGIRKGTPERSANALMHAARYRMMAQRHHHPCKPDDLTLILARIR